MSQQIIIRIIGGGEYDLESFRSDVVYVGRGPKHGKLQESPNNQIQLPNINTISRAAFCFMKSNGYWVIRNDSSAPILCNGLPVTEQPLCAGARYQLGVVNGVPACELECEVREVREPVYPPQPELPQPGPNGYQFDDDVNGRTIREDQGGLMPARKPTGPDEPIMISLVEKQQYVIGRAQGCDVCLPHPQVSRQHALIRREGSSLVLYDNHSTNGVMVNGRMMQQGRSHALADGDRISIACFTLNFRNGYLYCQEHKGGVSLEAIDVCKTVKDSNKGKNKTKNITDHVSLKIEPGEFVAIIGGSGAGKSTVMNCLSGMTDFTSGEVLVDGEPLNVGSTTLRSIIGYVPQADIVYDDLTLERMLMYSAKLRMPPDTTPEDIEHKIDETLATVELTEHRKTLIKKLSGGQKKRASMAVELLASPRLFFLDEPFSGLDPGTEKKLFLMLKKLSMSGKTVIMVTHSVQNIELVDRLVCMGRGGKLCYSGDPNKALSFFGVGSFTDVYDKLDNHSAELEAQFARYANRVNRSPSGTPTVMPQKPNTIRTHGARLKQFNVLTGRYAELTKNRTGRLVLLMLMPIILSLFVCVAFGMDGGLMNLLGIYERTSFPFLVGVDTESMLMTFACAAFWIGIFNSIQEISKESNIYHREQFTGVNPLPYLASKFVINLVLCLVQAAIMTGILYLAATYTVSYDGDIDEESRLVSYAVKLVSSGMVFDSVLLEMFVTTFLTMLSAMTLGLVVSSAVSNDMALVLCPICLLPQILFSGVVSTLKGATAVISNIITCRWSVLSYCFTVDINGDVVDHEMGQALKYVTDGPMAKATGFGASELGYQVMPYSTMSSDTPYEFASEFANKGYYKAAAEVATYDPDAHYLFGLNPVAASWLFLGLLILACFLIAWLILVRNSTRTAALQSVNGRKGKRRR